MNEVCSGCSLKKRGCNAQDSVSIYNTPLSVGDYLNCRHYTCRFGQEAAKQALLHGVRQLLTIDGVNIQVIPFGSEEKPFVLSNRYVSPHSGQIYTTFSNLHKRASEAYTSAVKISTK